MVNVNIGFFTEKSQSFQSAFFCAEFLVSELFRNPVKYVTAIKQNGDKTHKSRSRYAAPLGCKQHCSDLSLGVVYCALNVGG